MTITLRLTDILLIIITLSVAGVAVYLMATLKRLTSAMAEMERTLGGVRELLPRMQDAAVQARQTLGAVQELAEQGRRVAEDVAEVSAVARTVAEEGAEQVRGVLSTIGQVGAVVKGIQSGLEFFSARRQETAGWEDRDQEE